MVNTEQIVRSGVQEIRRGVRMYVMMDAASAIFREAETRFAPLMWQIDCRSRRSATS